MLLKVLILVLLMNSYLDTLVIDDQDPATVDYCKLPCTYMPKGQQRNTGCGCFRNSNHVEELFDLMEFRAAMVSEHNRLRNKIACGRQEFNDELFFPTASRMRALSYSIEMEYIARCWSVMIWNYHDDCRRTTTSFYVGQNIAFGPDQFHLYNASAYGGWYREYRYYDPKYIHWYWAPDGVDWNDIGHFSQYVWDSVFRVGCGRGYQTIAPATTGHYHLICNYGGTNRSASNVRNTTIYKEGPPASDCAHYGIKPNKDYPCLCGEVDPITTQAPTRIYAEGESRDDAVMTTSIPFAVLIVLYLLFNLH